MYLDYLETAPDYDRAKMSIEKSLWGEKLEDIRNAIDDVKDAHESKVTSYQEELYKKAIKKQIHKKHGELNYEDAKDAYDTLKEKKSTMIEQHANRMALVDLELNFLMVRAEKVRHKNNAERDLRRIYNKHVDQLSKWMNDESDVDDEMQRPSKSPRN